MSDADAGVERVSLSALDGSGRARLFDGEPKTIRLTLSAGETIPPHRHPDRDIVFHVLSGEVDLTVDETTLTLSAGDVARFDGDRDISPAAVTDCEALLVLAESA